MAADLPQVRIEAIESVADAYDCKGRPALRSSTGGWTSAASIVVVELNERITSLGIAVNLVTYMTGTMHVGSAAAANAVTNFLGTSFILCLFGGFLADSFLGRYLTVAIFALIQATGVSILAISTAVPGLRPPKCVPETETCVPATATQLSVLYLALYVTALGTGGLKSSVSGFGSDQFDESDAGEKRMMTKFFNYFFFIISLGSLLSVTVFVYIQDNVGRKWGYGTIAACILVGLVVFLSGTRRYRYKKIVGSPITEIAAVLAAAWRNRKLEVPSDSSRLFDVQEAESQRHRRRKEQMQHTDQFRFLDHAAVKHNEDEPAQNRWHLSTMTDVEEVKEVVRMLPIWATTVMFWTIYAQMTTFSVAQATTMDRNIGPSFKIPSGSLTVFFVGSILLTVPFYDRVVVPISRRFTKNPAGLTPLQCIAVGLVLSIFAMVAAALTELKRLHVARSTPGALEEGAIVPLRVFWLVPQFFFVGSGEAFTYIGQLDFFLRECPNGMKTMSTGLFMSTMALGFFVSSVLVTIVHRVTGREGNRAWLADNLNRGRLYNFYWLLAVISCVNLAVYLVCARWYIYKETHCGAKAREAEMEEVTGSGEQA